MSGTGRVLSVAGIAGSLRSGSFNRALLRTARELAPDGLDIGIHEIAELPLYNEDIEAEGVPPVVAVLRDAVAAADGLLIATPEYNHGVPGVLKNAIDWLSRPPRRSVLDGKPTAVMGASSGMTGSARGQSQLRQSFVFTNTPVMPQPEILVARAREKFAAGRLSDEVTLRLLGRFLTAFVVWIERFSDAPR